MTLNKLPAVAADKIMVYLIEEWGFRYFICYQKMSS